MITIYNIYDIYNNNYVGMITLIKKAINILECLVGYNGRILGIKLKDIQIWNVYPPSGTENNKDPSGSAS